MSDDIQFQDAAKLLDEHRHISWWLKEAAEYLERRQDCVVDFQSSMRYEWGFSISVAPEIWRGQLDHQIEKQKKRLTELDAALRAYLDAGK